MALLQKIKEKLGIGGGTSDSGAADTEVTVERETGEESEPGTADVAGSDDIADADTEEVTEPDDISDADAADVADSDDEPVATETEAAASTESLVDGEDADPEPDSAAEPAEAAGPGTDDVATGDDSVPVDQLKGIGPAYAERLADIGIESVADLAAADPETVGEGTSVGEKRAATWIERAQEF